MEYLSIAFVIFVVMIFSFMFLYRNEAKVKKKITHTDDYYEIYRDDCE